MRAVALMDHGMTASQVDEEIGAYHGFTKFWSDRYHSDDSIHDADRSGRPRTVLTEKTKMEIDNIMHEDHDRSFEVVANELLKKGIEVSLSSVKAGAYESHHKTRRRIKQPGIQEKQMERRLAFAEKYVNEPISFWRHGVYGDEKLFSVDPSNSASQMWVHFCEGETEADIPVDQLYRQVVQYPGNVMTFGAVSYYGRTHLHCMQPGIKFKSTYYINNVLKKYVAPSMRGERGSAQLGYDDSITLKYFQDLATPHTAHATQEWMSENLPDFFSKAEVPPICSDINPMDRLWAIVDTAMGKYKYKNVEELKACFHQVWKDIPQSTIQKLIDSIKPALRKIVDTGGYYVHK